MQHSFIKQKQYKLLFYVTLLLLSYQIMQAQERAVAVVYDNSRSMSDAGQCEGINYALQLMVGLLHEEDELSVFRMDPPKGDAISLKNKQQSINSISNTYNCQSGKTPFDAVLQAKDILAKSRKKGKWLIMLSDGEITEKGFEKNYETSPLLRNFVDDTGARIIFLDVSKKANLLESFLKTSETPHDRLRTSGSFEQIIERMEQIAQSIMTLSSDGVPVKPAGNKVTIDSPVPLKRIIVLQQEAKKNASLPKITNANSNGKRIFAGDGYKAEKSKGTYKMSGLINHIQAAPNSKEVIEKGKITIDFDAPINVKQTKFLPEVAATLEVDLRGSIKGKKGNIYTVCDTANSVTVVAKIIDYQGNTLDKKVLKDSKLLLINEDKKSSQLFILDEKTGEFTTNLKLHTKRFPISVSAEYAGFFNFQSNIYIVEKAFCPVKKANITADKNTLKAKVTNMSAAPTVTVSPQIKFGDEPARSPNAEEMKDLYIEKLNDTRVGIDVTEKNGKMYIKPTTFLCACFTTTGKDELELVLRSKNPNLKIGDNATLTLQIEIEDDSFWAKCGILIIAFIVLLLLLWYIWGIFKKPRFCKGSEIIISKQGQLTKSRPKSYPLPTGFFNRYLVPYVAESKAVGSIKFKAGSRCSHVLIAKETQTEDMFVSGFPIDEPNKKDLRLSIGEKLEISKRTRKEIYEYNKL